MKKIFFLACLLFVSLLSAQVTSDILVNVHNVTATEMTALSPNAGALAYNTTDNFLYTYNGASWDKLEDTESTTYESVTLPSIGNQTINVSNANKIVGFTLLSKNTNLSVSTGIMSATWFINNERARIRCYLQTLEHPYMKFLVVSVLIDNAANTIQISEYNSRTWKYDAAVPQTSLSTSNSDYELDKIIIIRNE